MLVSVGVDTLCMFYTGESREYTTLVNCTSKLELALTSDRGIAHFLDREKLITEETHTRVMSPYSTSTPRQLAGLIVTDLKNKVSLNHKNYDVFFRYIRPRREYQDIVEILNSEYKRLGAITTSSTTSSTASVSASVIPPATNIATSPSFAGQYN